MARLSKTYPSQEQINELFHYDSGNLIWRIEPRKRGKLLIGQKAGHKGHLGYWIVSWNGQQYRANILIWILHNGSVTREIDHIDRNKLNNKIENLRETTSSQNNRNKSIKGNSTSQFKGVRKRKNRWHAELRVDGKKLFLGSFVTEKEAALAYNEAAIKYFGEFAFPNKVA